MSLSWRLVTAMRSQIWKVQQESAEVIITSDTKAWTRKNKAFLRSFWEEVDRQTPQQQTCIDDMGDPGTWAWGERGVPPPAGKMSSTLFPIETGTEQIAHDQPSRSGGAGIIHLMNREEWGQGTERRKFSAARNS